MAESSLCTNTTAKPVLPPVASKETLDRKSFCFLGIYLFDCVGLGHGTWDLSPLTRDQTCVPCIGRKILNHWANRGSPDRKFLKGICCGRKYLPTKYILNKCRVVKCQKSHFFCYEIYLLNQWEWSSYPLLFCLGLYLIFLLDELAHQYISTKFLYSFTSLFWFWPWNPDVLNPKHSGNF